MPNKWSPEPWFERSDAPINLTAANYDRARECVNALAGVADPAEYRAAKVELLEAAKETLARREGWDLKLQAAIARVKQTGEGNNERKNTETTN